MFNVRRHHFQARDGLNRRVLWEEFLTWGNKLNNLDSDTVQKYAFTRASLRYDAKIGLNGTTTWNKQLLIFTGGLYYGGIEFTKDHYNGPGEYLITWSIGGRISTDDSTYIMAAYPFVGSQLLRALGDSAEHPSVFNNGTFIPADGPPTIDNYFPADSRFTLACSGVALIEQESSRAGLFVLSNQGGKFKVTYSDLSIVEFKQ